MPPITVLIKPASGMCNLSCQYCFYADEQEHRKIPSYGFMSLELMEMVVEKSIAFAEKECTFAFQGGEPTLNGLAFYQEVVNMQKKYQRKGVRIQNVLQTNGYMIDNDWAEFLANNQFLVGLSLDGDKDCHDRFRLDKQGKGTFNKIMRATQILKKHQVSFHILTVVNGMTAKYAKRNYNFFKKNGFSYQQYIECLDPIGAVAGTQLYSLKPEIYAEFLKNLFDVWYLDQIKGEYVYNRYFENLIGLLAGKMPESCSMRGTCGKQWIIEADGSVFPCDFYATDEWKLGNIKEDSFETMDIRREELGFVQRSYEVPEECKTCKWFPLCRNGCYRHREQNHKEIGNRTYFCMAYQEFFEYAYPRLVEVLEKWYH